MHIGFSYFLLISRTYLNIALNFYKQFKIVQFRCETVESSVDIKFFTL